MKLKQLLLVVLVSAGSAIGSVWAYNKFSHTKTAFVQTQNGLPVNYAGFTEGSGSPAEIIDFTKAASAAVPAVVHIKTKIPAKKVSNNLGNQRNMMNDDFFDQFFNFGPQVIPEQRASGSGVIISEDGYIVTNNHVISDGDAGIAPEITVTLSNKKVYKARVVGNDPSYDLAVLKIDGNGFPFMLYGNSDEVKLGQWVLAVGYPLSLEATVTAGIVSAKGRTIGINSRQSNTPVESFIQTDAAVNQGNSGGALINTGGQLIGINSAILAPNGTYAGYSFAIPVTLVKKVVNDIIQYGNVQRGYLGVTYPTQELSEEQLKQFGFKDGVNGVYVSGVAPGGGAEAAGLKRGDIITKVNDMEVASGLEMSSIIGNYKPGDKITISYLRKGSEANTTVTLKKTPGNYDEVVKANVTEQLGAELETVDGKTADKFNIEGGVSVKKIIDGGAISKTRMQKDFIITNVNDMPVKSIDELAKALSAAGGNVRLEGIYPGYEGTYAYPLNLSNN